MTSSESPFSHLSFTFASAARNRAHSRPINLNEAAATAFVPFAFTSDCISKAKVIPLLRPNHPS